MCRFQVEWMFCVLTLFSVISGIAVWRAEDVAGLFLQLGGYRGSRGGPVGAQHGLSPGAGEELLCPALGRKGLPDV